MRPIPNENEPSAFLTLNQAAGTIGCTRRFIEERIKDGEITIFRPSARLIRIRRTDLERWISTFTHGVKGTS